MAESLQRYAVVTGENKGILLAICKQLASEGVMVVLTARDEKRGLEALENLKESGLSDYTVFHRLDMTDHASITCLADFVQNRFGKLDILVNNAAIGGHVGKQDALEASKVSETKVNKPLGFILRRDQALMGIANTFSMFFVLMILAYIMYLL